MTDRISRSDGDLDDFRDELALPTEDVGDLPALREEDFLAAGDFDALRPDFPLLDNSAATMSCILFRDGVRDLAIGKLACL
jgi:hypothetical protein